MWCSLCIEIVSCSRSFTLRAIKRSEFLQGFKFIWRSCSEPMRSQIPVTSRRFMPAHLWIRQLLSRFLFLRDQDRPHFYEPSFRRALKVSCPRFKSHPTRKRRYDSNNSWMFFKEAPSSSLSLKPDCRAIELICCFGNACIVPHNRIESGQDVLSCP